MTCDLCDPFELQSRIEYLILCEKRKSLTNHKRKSATATASATHDRFALFAAHSSLFVAMKLMLRLLLSKIDWAETM